MNDYFFSSASGPLIDMNNVIPSSGSVVSEDNNLWRLAFSEEVQLCEV